MRSLLMIVAAGFLAACTTTAPYGPASKAGGMGYTSQQIETGRHQISYTDTDPQLARDRALLRAAEITLFEGNDWFEITNSYTDSAQNQPRSRSSVSIGGSSGSYGSGVGVGVGIGLPLGGSSGSVTEVIEIMTGSGEKPDRPSVYDAQSVEFNLRSSMP